ncbi:MAG: septation protein SepH [Micropruina sp.]|uniref:septation protein SepH n=1 Tax=Micropruina sp. TaxID=2737536 RepID=UPI0039E35464
MRTAHPLGLSPDGSTLIVVLDDGEEIGIPADQRLKAALRNDRPRIGQLEIDMESALRPRDIQARIRAGESLEAVAQAAGVPIARIEPFAAPVIAEREHIAGLAQTNPVRRAGDAVAHRSLRNVITDRLLSRGIDPDSVDWDAWRTEDRRWTVRLSYQSGAAQHRADFTYDQTGRFSTAANDEARWLTGEHSDSHGPQPGRRRRSDHPDAGSAPSHNDELAIVRAIQPQFEVSPDLEPDDLDESDDDRAPEDDGSSDSEDAFAEGDLAEVDGVYDIVPGDRSSMDVLYDMLSSFDEDSVQIYAGLVRPRPEESAAPVLDEGPTDAEPTEPVADADLSGENAVAVESDEEIDDLEAEVASSEPAPTALANAASDDDVVVAEPNQTDESLDAAAELAADEPDAVPEPIADTEPIETDSGGGAEPDVEAATVEASEPPASEVAEPTKPAPKPRSGRAKTAPAEPEQPSLVDDAGNEPSRPVRRKRASVPSWDEIMFGAPKPRA